MPCNCGASSCPECMGGYVHTAVSAPDPKAGPGEERDACPNCTHESTIEKRGGCVDCHHSIVGVCHMHAAVSEVSALKAQLAEAREALRDFRDNFDCDADAHRYGTTCRACKSGAILAKLEGR